MSDIEILDAPRKRGRPKGYSPKKAQLVEADLINPDDDQTSLTVRKAKAQTEKEEWLARQAELDYKKDAKEYISRSAFREASATLLAEVAQALRSLPDMLERKCNLSTDQITLAEKVVDDCLLSLAEGLSKQVGDE